MIHSVTLTIHRTLNKNMNGTGMSQKGDRLGPGIEHQSLTYVTNQNILLE